MLILESWSLLLDYRGVMRVVPWVSSWWVDDCGLQLLVLFWCFCDRAVPIYLRWGRKLVLGNALIEKDLAFQRFLHCVVAIDFLITLVLFVFELYLSAFTLKPHDWLLSLISFWTQRSTLLQLKLGIELLALLCFEPLNRWLNDSDPLPTGWLKWILIIKLQNC